MVKVLMLGNGVDAVCEEALSSSDQLDQYFSSLTQATSTHKLLRVRDPAHVLGKHPRHELETRISEEDMLEVSVTAWLRLLQLR
ncbi:hypothetical protein PI125_g18768 [Phytophthora idaei]|nr:hypothetical protein PI125_g18768 [Phytophthora idaei]